MAICAFTSSHRAEPSYPAPKPRQECLFARNSVLGQKIPEKKLSLPSKRPNQTMARVIFLTDFSEAYARELLLGMARYAHDTAQAWSLCRLAAVVDTRQVRHRGGGRMGRANEGRRRDRAVLQHGQRRSVPRKRHHRHRSGFQEAFHDDPQHHRAAPPCRPHGRGVFPEKGVPQLRLLRDAGHRLLGRTLPGFPRDRRTGKPRFHLLVTAQRRPERPVVLRHGAAHHMAAIAAQTGGHHGLRRQPGVPYHRGVPPDRGGGGIRVFRTT